ncbi:MAG TPA: TonB family protein, partial [Thermoanaerobaculia bacterium]|nr:TonB family protein [Thermoanaerobaculia bacterium]
MNIPEEFGKYLLLKKLTEDPLGETFRAGRVGKEGMEQVVLLRVFNGKGLDGERLWQKISGRGAVQESLKSPTIGSGVDLGRVRSFPYVVYDYVSGKNLATLFAQAERTLSPIPTDHALLVAERIALALAAAYETRVQDERILHGFMVPHLVMISNEGETRLLGFEAAPGLRELAAGGWQDEAIRPYLAPEAFTGAPLSRADDVWSLGAVLYELLTGERLPAAAPDGYAGVIDRALLANEGTPLPEPVAALLKKSLAPREARFADAVTWHKTLSKMMIEGHYSPTTFNLAFFMHNLFRDEIDRESQEIEAEKRDIPQQVAAAAAATAVTPIAPVAPVRAPVDMRETTGVREGTLAGARVATAGPASKAPLWIGIAAAALIVLAGVGWYLFGRSGGAPQVARQPMPSGTVQTAAMPSTAPPVQAVPAGPSQEELQAQIDSMFEARSKEMEDKLKSQYDDRIKQLQQQLEDSRKGAAERERLQAEQRLAQAAAPPPVETRPVAPPPRPEPTPQQQAPQITIPTAPALQPPASDQATKEEEPERTVERPAAPAPAQPQPAAPRQPQVQYGDMVQMGPGVTGPKLSSRLDPRYPPAAQKLNRAAQVDIKVLVDEKGRVMDAERIGAKAGFGFDEAALDAARRATFQPATKDGVRVKMWT